MQKGKILVKIHFLGIILRMFFLLLKETPERNKVVNTANFLTLHFLTDVSMLNIIMLYYSVTHTYTHTRTTIPNCEERCIFVIIILFFLQFFLL